MRHCVITLNVPVNDRKNPPTLKFPERCVNCGKASARAWSLNLSTGEQKRGQMVELELSVPLCAACAAKEDKIANVTWLPFFIAGLLVCVVAFIPVWLVTPEVQTSQPQSLPLLLGALVGLIAGIIGGTFVEFVLKLLFAPAYGQLLLRRPLTAFMVFSNVEQVIGLTARLSKDKQTLHLVLENDEVANEFKRLNMESGVL